MGRFNGIGYEEQPIQAEPSTTDVKVNLDEKPHEFSKKVEPEDADKALTTETPVGENDPAPKPIEVDTQDHSNCSEALAKNMGDSEKEIVDATKDLNETCAALESLYQAYDAVASTSEHQGGLNQADAKMLNVTLESIVRNLPNINLDVPSSESYCGTDASTTECSLEGVFAAIGNVINLIETNLLRLANVATGYATKLLSRANGLEKLALATKNRVTGAHREDGLKEVTGNWVKHLAVDGRIPEPNTLFKTLTTTDAVVGEVLGQTSSDRLLSLNNQMIDNVLADLKRGDITKPSKFWYVLLYAVQYGGTVMMSGLPGGVITAAGLGMLLKKCFRSDLVGKTAVSKMAEVYSAGIPNLAKELPNCAKNNVATDSKYITSKCSDPLFNGTVVSVNSISADAEMTLYETTNLDNSMFASACAAANGITLKYNGASKETTIRALTGKEQQQVIDQVISLLATVKQFESAFPKRATTLYNSYRTIYKKVAGVAGGYRNVAPGNRLAFKAFITATNNFARYQYNSVYKGQRVVVEHVLTVCDALIKYVDASSQVANAD